MILRATASTLLFSAIGDPKIIWDKRISIGKNRPSENGREEIAGVQCADTEGGERSVQKICSEPSNIATK